MSLEVMDWVRVGGGGGGVRGRRSIPDAQSFGDRNVGPKWHAAATEHYYRAGFKLGRAYTDSHESD